MGLEERVSGVVDIPLHLAASSLEPHSLQQPLEAPRHPLRPLYTCCVKTRDVGLVPLMMKVGGVAGFEKFRPRQAADQRSRDQKCHLRAASPTPSFEEHVDVQAGRETASDMFYLSAT